ncbi:MAG: 50S ribosomal protein L25 [Desulfotomaculaceae bacterium]|nr:50S ribosomal protein L25 [Desulfotomaculaceae bacterium]
MEVTILNAIDRSKQSGKFREKGFVSGVLYGNNIFGAKSVKFETSAINKIIASHGSNAKVWINYNGNKKFGFIKEVQRDAISGRIAHLDVHIVPKDHEVKLQIPVTIKGEDVLAAKNLRVQMYKSEFTVMGMINLMPEEIQVDVSDMKLGDSITSSNFNLDKRLRVSEQEDAVYGMIINQPIVATDVTEAREDMPD